MSAETSRAHAFGYHSFDIDADSGVLRCSYWLDDWTFEERITLGPGWQWDAAAREAARLVFLLAGISYYKAGAPAIVDFGDIGVRDGERDFLRSFYLEGLGEFAFRNRLHLGDIGFKGGRPAGPAPAVPADPMRPLVPFGGGLDSSVTVELLRERGLDPQLFVVSGAGNLFDTIERAAAATELPVLRAERELDPQILRSKDNGFLNGHVPVTGILSAIAVLAAVLDRCGMVVMSNEWSASVGSVQVDGTTVNHQYSKSLAFEEGFASMVRGALDGSVRYFSLLRPYTELWIAERFSKLDRYHPVFRSCNRAFYIDSALRLDQWCGECDKCCFIDLILSPFLAAAQLEDIFDRREPLANAALIPRFQTLLGTSVESKPFECVGDIDECRAALALAARRSDRAGSPVIHSLMTELGSAADDALEAAPALLRPMGSHHIPDAIAPADLLV
jgi:hypothetical protein